MINLSGKNVLITGSSRGIGKATALRFAEAGANVAITFERNESAAKETINALSTLGIHTKQFKVHHRDEQALSVAIDEIVREWGTLDAVVANAGIWKEAAVEEMTVEQFEETMEVNMTFSFLLAKHAARVMKVQGSGAIVLVSSTAGQRGEALHSHYAASKGAQISFTKSLAAELAPFGIRTNCVAPGWVATDMTLRTLEDPEEAEKVYAVIPLRRVAQPEEIANAIVFIASSLASFINGEILNVNGGAVLVG
jgi:3-oxoacyl-[acyl-carrier protein] reductase